VIGRAPDDGLERAGTLGLGRHRLVANLARRQLDPVPDDHVRGDQLGERVERTTAELRLRPGADQPSGEPVRGAYVAVGEPGHCVTSSDDTPAWRVTRRRSAAP
jgi:hypothetical protein